MAEITGPQVSMTVGHDGRLHKRASSYRRYREARKDPTIRLARSLVIAPVLAAQWSVEAEDGAPEGASDFIDKALSPFRLHLLRTATLGCIDFGWQPYEKVFGVRSDGMVILQKLKPLLQDRTDILVDKATGAYAGLRQEQPNEVSLTPEMTLCIAVDVEGTDWYGYAQMETALDPYDQWKDVNSAANRYDKKIAGAHWVIKYPIGKSYVKGVEKDNFEIAKEILDHLKAAGSAIIPRKKLEDTLEAKDAQEWDVQLLSATGHQTEFVARMSYLDKLKVRAMGLPERSVLEGEFGTKAEASVHADLAITNMELRHLVIAEHVNFYVVNQLLRVNYGQSAENAVRIVPAPLTDLQRQWMQELYTAMLSNENGFLAEYDRVDLDSLREKLGIPTRELSTEPAPQV